MGLIGSLEVTCWYRMEQTPALVEVVAGIMIKS